MTTTPQAGHRCRAPRDRADCGSYAGHCPFAPDGPEGLSSEEIDTLRNGHAYYRKRVVVTGAADLEVITIEVEASVSEHVTESGGSEAGSHRWARSGIRGNHPDPPEAVRV